MQSTVQTRVASTGSPNQEVLDALTERFSEITGIKNLPHPVTWGIANDSEQGEWYSASIFGESLIVVGVITETESVANVFSWQERARDVKMTLSEDGFFTGSGIPVSQECFRAFYRLLETPQAAQVAA